MPLHLRYYVRLCSYWPTIEVARILQAHYMSLLHNRQLFQSIPPGNAAPRSALRAEPSLRWTRCTMDGANPTCPALAASSVSPLACAIRRMSPLSAGPSTSADLRSDSVL